VRCRRHAANDGSAVISFGVIASRVRRQEKIKAMRAGTVAWSRIIGVCFQFNDFVVVKRGRNGIPKHLTQLLVENAMTTHTTGNNLMPEVVISSTMS
jgi:hypothetical protein